MRLSLHRICDKVPAVLLRVIGLSGVCNRTNDEVCNGVCNRTNDEVCNGVCNHMNNEQNNYWTTAKRESDLLITRQYNNYRQNWMT